MGSVMGAALEQIICVAPIESDDKKIQSSKNQVVVSYDRYKELQQAEIEKQRLQEEIEILQSNLHPIEARLTSISESSVQQQQRQRILSVSVHENQTNSCFQLKSDDERPYQLTKKISQIIQNEELHIDLGLQFDGNCSSISTCLAIKRIIKILRWYSFCGDDHDKILRAIKDNSYDQQILNDYHHILNFHLNNKDINAIKYEFDMMYNQILKYVKPCELKQCAGFLRHHRQREVEINGNINKENEAEIQFYIDTLDSIHCYFMHSYDTAMRHKIDEYDETKTDYVDDEDEKKVEYLDDKMKKMREKLKQKWENLNNIVSKNNVNGNKFFTKAAKTGSDTDKYCFGHKLYYWHHYKCNSEMDYGPNIGYKKSDWYICKKYCNLKAELLLNKIWKLSKTCWDHANKKAESTVKCDYVKRRLSDNSPLSEYSKIKPGSSIDKEHILAVILYCDYSKLSYNFGATFRYNEIDTNEMSFEFADELDEELKGRNSEYWHWSKLLRETVELYGSNMSNSGIKLFYHGISFMTFSKFLAYFCAPTSTTTMMEVAVNFAGDDGIIIEIEKENSYSPCKYFDCSWLSAFGNEDERLFFGDNKPVKFHSIRGIRNNEDYYYFIHALTLFDYLLEGKSLTNDDKVKVKDYVIISELMMQHDFRTKYKNEKIPLYVNRLFTAFCEDRKHIKINLTTMNRDYPGFETYLICKDEKKLILFDYLAVIFPFCEQISVWGQGNMSTVFMDKLLNILGNMFKSNRGYDALKIIELHDARFNYKHLNQIFMQKYEAKFKLSAHCDISFNQNINAAQSTQQPMKGSLLCITRKSFVHYNTRKHEGNNEPSLNEPSVFSYQH